MNPGVSSREAILQVCREIAAEKGISALNMRAVAEKCGVALGTLYHYYSDKDELLIATVESIWKDVFRSKGICETPASFADYVAALVRCVREGAAKYPDFPITHSVVIAKARKDEARSAMEHSFEHIKAGMLAVLQADSAVSPSAFSPSFTESDLVDFVLDHILLLLGKREENGAVLAELVRRIIYR